MRQTDGNLKIDSKRSMALGSIGAAAVSVLVASVQKTAKAMDQAAKAQEQLAKTTQTAAKSAKGALAGFDELDVLVKKKAAASGTKKEQDAQEELQEIGKGNLPRPGTQLHQPILAQGDLELYDAALGFKEEWDAVFNAIWTGWKLNAAMLTGNIPLLFSELGQLVGAGWSDTLAPMLDSASAALSAWLNDSVQPCFDAVLLNLNELVANAPAVLSGFVQPLADGFNNVFLPAVRTSSQTAADVFSTLGVTLGGILDSMMLSFTGVGEFLLGTFTADWQRAWGGVKDVFAAQWAAMTALAKGSVNFVVSLVNGMIRTAVEGINFLIRQMNKISFDVPQWVPGIGGMSFGVHIDPIEPYQIPFLASGAVIPPNAQFLAMLGDQKNGRNLEAPEGLIRQIVREESTQQGMNLNITAKGTAGEFVRWLRFELGQEEQRLGDSFLKGGADYAGGR